MINATHEHCYIILHAPRISYSGIADEVLSGKTVEVNTLKLRAFCESELQQIKSSGKLDPGGFLHAALRSLALLFKVDVQQIESINSLIRLLSTRCRSITLELLWARITIKKTIVPDSVHDAKWSFLKPGLSRLFDQLISVCSKGGSQDPLIYYNKSMAHMLTLIPTRFSCPAPLYPLASRSKGRPLGLWSRTAWAWAHKQCGVIFKKLKELHLELHIAVVE
jgi:hypothetical protein